MLGTTSPLSICYLLSCQMSNEIVCGIISSQISFKIKLKSHVLKKKNADLLPTTAEIRTTQCYS